MKVLLVDEPVAILVDLENDKFTLGPEEGIWPTRKIIQRIVFHMTKYCDLVGDYVSCIYHIEGLFKLGDLVLVEHGEDIGGCPLRPLLRRSTTGRCLSG